MKDISSIERFFAEAVIENCQNHSEESVLFLVENGRIFLFKTFNIKF
jgi:hypothetical protein